MNESARTATGSTAVIARIRSTLPGPDILGALLLVLATAVALVWANVGGASYENFWHTHLTLTLGDTELDLSIQHWINDGVMALFFLLVSLEVKHDLTLGELRIWRRASVPMIAAVAGLLVPALIFLAINGRADSAHAWGIVISTDTAFVIGLLAVFGNRLPAQLRAFLVTLAVVDDVGALLVIAFFYTDTLSINGLVWTAILAVVVHLMQRLRVWRAGAYVVVAVLLWLAVLESGMHATIAGVILGLLLPVYPPARERVLRAERLTHAFRRTPQANTGRSAVDGILSSVSVNDRFQLALRPAIAFVVVPTFALANAGVLITGDSLERAFTSSLTWAVIAGLVAGKFLGIVVGTIAATRLQLGELSSSIHTRHIASGAMLTGIGFTISLFIIDLALDDPAQQSDARIGVLTASLLAAALGVVALIAVARYDAARAPARLRLSRPIDPGRDHLAGDPDAPLTLVEYGRFGDPDNAILAEVVDEVLETLGDRVAYVYRHNTLGDLMARQAALGLEAVAAQSPRLFWVMRDELNEASRDAELDSRAIDRAAVESGANHARVADEGRRQIHVAQVDDDNLDAESMRLTEVPRFFVNGELYDGPVQPEALLRALDPDGVGRPAQTEAHT